MKSNGREDSGRYGIVLGSDVVLKVDPQASFSAAVDELTADAIDTSRKTGRTGKDGKDGKDGNTREAESVVVSTARSAERTLLALVDGRRTVQELVRLAGMSDLVVRRHLRALCERGILVPATSGRLVTPGSSSDSAVPERTASPGSGGVPGESGGEGLSKALAAYLDSGKTAVVQTLASDAITAKAAGGSGSVGTPAAEGIGSKTLLMGSPVGSDASSRVVVVKAAGPESGSTAVDPAGAPFDADAGGRVSSPPASVVVGDLPHQPNTPANFKPNVTAFWIPSASEPSTASTGATAGSPPSGAAGSSPAAASPSPSATAAAPASPTAGVTALPATTLMWPKLAEVATKSGRRRSPAHGNVIVTVGDAAGGASAGGAVAGGAVDRPAAQGGPPEPKPAALSVEGPSSQVASQGGARSKNAAIPFRLGEYEVATRIAQGGMGSIYVCRRAGTPGVQRLFTLKVVRQHAKQIAQVVQSFRREARVGALLSHPNLQTVIHVGTYHEQPFLILDYVEGIGLAELLASHKRLPPAIVVSILVDVLRGLKAAHDLVDEQGNRLGLVHGDISPQNILIGVDGNARLTDFGSSRFSSDARVADLAPLVGKPAFMAPEQLSAEPLDARTDLFSVGVLMWTALTGQPLFAADSYEQIVMNVFRKKIPPPSEFGAPACFDEISTTALSRAPEGRYSNAEEMANALSRVARAEGIVGSPYDVGQWVRREFAETLAERRRRVQVVFGGVGSAPPPGPAAPAAGEAGGSPAGGEKPGETTADGYPRLPSRTMQLAAMPRQRSTPRLRTLESTQESDLEAPVLRWTRRRVVAVSAAISFPFALALAYLATNPIARRIRQAQAAAATVAEPVGTEELPGGGAPVPPAAADSPPRPEARGEPSRALQPPAEAPPTPGDTPAGVGTLPPAASTGAAAPPAPAEPGAPSPGAALPPAPAGASRTEPR
jgi:serine/threonine-protein kinase